MATELIDDIQDVYATIRYWRNIGVRVVDVAADLHCSRNWQSVERSMLRWLLVYEMVEELQEAA